MKRTLAVAVPLLTLILVGISLGQWQRNRYFQPLSESNYKPQWENDSEFGDDVFTFVRIRYTSDYGNYSSRRYRGRSRGGGREKWRVDYPDSELNFSFRLQQLTSLKVNPLPIILDLNGSTTLQVPLHLYCGTREFAVQCRGSLEFATVPE